MDGYNVNNEIFEVYKVRRILKKTKSKDQFSWILSQIVSVE